jgi:hypothetical protein
MIIRMITKMIARTVVRTKQQMILIIVLKIVLLTLVQKVKIVTNNNKEIMGKECCGTLFLLWEIGIDTKTYMKVK